MNLLLLKILVSPALLGLASLAGRKWGHSISGWIVALPLTSGPIVFFLALSHGPAFAADTAAGILAGGLSLSVFTLLYAHLALRWKWLPTLLASSLAFFIMTALLRPVRLPLVPLWMAVLGGLALSFRLLPPPPPFAPTTEHLPGPWDIPLRMAIAAAFVLGITALAPVIGPHLAGLLAPFPFFTATLAAFAQHQFGGGAAISVLRGLLLGLIAFASFMFTLALLLVPAGLAGAFAASILVAIAFHASALWLLRRGTG